jgi:hypothetical protein
VETRNLEELLFRGKENVVNKSKFGLRLSILVLRCEWFYTF